MFITHNNYYNLLYTYFKLYPYFYGHVQNFWSQVKLYGLFNFSPQIPCQCMIIKFKTNS